MRCIAAWSSSSDDPELPFVDSCCATQRFFEVLAFRFGFAAPDLVFGALLFAFAGFTGFAGALGGFAAAIAGFAGALACTTGIGCAGVGLTTGTGRAGVRELAVLSGGSGCLRGRPLFRAA